MMVEMMLAGRMGEIIVGEKNKTRFCKSIGTNLFMMSVLKSIVNATFSKTKLLLMRKIIISMAIQMHWEMNLFFPLTLSHHSL